MELAEDRDRWRALVGTVRDWMELAEDRDMWRALVGTVRDFLD
jgi:hypothetical protein